MLNLLRMDLYRLRMSKSVYVCFAMFILTEILCYLMVYLFFTPGGQKTALKIGMVQVSEIGEHASALEGVDSLEMFRESAMDGGVYCMLFGVVTALFVCMDFQGGFVKNIMCFYRERWKYIGSKLVTAGILNSIYLLLGFTFNSLLNLLFGQLVPFTGLTDSLFYLCWIWLIAMAFAALIILLCVFTRSTTVGVLAAVLGSSGAIVLVLANLMGYFNLEGWVKYTLYYNMTYGPSSYSGLGDLKVVSIGLIFLVIYTVASAVSLMKQDI